MPIFVGNIRPQTLKNLYISPCRIAIALAIFRSPNFAKDHKIKTRNVFYHKCFGRLQVKTRYVFLFQNYLRLCIRFFADVLDKKMTHRIDRLVFSA